MADQKTPVGTDKLPDSPALVNLKEREKVLSEKLNGLAKLDANEQARGGVDVNEVKNRVQLQLAEIRKAIQKETK